MKVKHPLIHWNDGIPSFGTAVENYFLVLLITQVNEDLICILIMKPLCSHPGYDVIAQAQSGTGKTATFAISILQQLDMEQKETQALVLAPTRELAQQVCCTWGQDKLKCVSDQGGILNLKQKGIYIFPTSFLHAKSTNWTKGGDGSLRIGVVSVHGCIALKVDLTPCTPLVMGGGFSSLL